MTAISIPLVMSASDTEPVGEGRLVARLRDGERAAVDEAYRTHHAAIRGFARRLVGDPAAAEDFVHEAFVALPRAILRFRGDSSLRAFLIGVAANHSLIRLGRYAEARAALLPFARGELAGDYRRAEAEQLVERLARER